MNSANHNQIRIMLYSHDTFGLGHYRRSLLISQYLLKKNSDYCILLATGSPVAGQFRIRGKFDYIKLPSVIKTGVEKYASRYFMCSYEHIQSCRENILVQTVQHYQPHILLVDHSPIGVKGELLPTLKYIKENLPNTRVLLGLRDILDEPELVKKIWSEENIYQHIENFYDRILIYGLKELFDVDEKYGFKPFISKKIKYMGYIYGGQPKRNPLTIKEQLQIDNKPMILLTAGGGDDGFPIFKTYLEMIKQFKKKIKFYSCLVTGPLMKIQERKLLESLIEPDLVKLIEFERDLIGMIIASDLVISMGGYNSICEILQFAERAVIVPRIYPRKEQYIRARILEDRKLLSLISPNELNPEKLYQLIESGLTSGTHTQIRQRLLLLKTQGLENLDREIKNLIAS